MRTKTLIAATVGMILAACNSGAKKAAEPGAMLRSLDSKLTQSLPGVKDAASARAKATELGYLDGSLCAGGLKGGEEVLYATSADTEDEAGQASGVLVKRGTGLFFEQRKSHNIVFYAPGVTSTVPQVSAWEFKAYFELICRVAFDIDGLKGAMRYDAVSAEIVDLEGETAGLAVSHKNILHVKLKRLSDGKIATEVSVFLKKGFGVVGLEFVEWYQYTPDSAAMNRARFRLFVNDAGGSGAAEAATLSARAKSCLAKGGKYPGHSLERCFGAALEAPDEAACKNIGGVWYPWTPFGDEPERGCHKEISL